MKRIVYAALLCVLSFTANAATFNVISGTFDMISPTQGSLGLVQLTGNGGFTEGVFTGSAAGIATDPNATYAGITTASFFPTLGLDFYFASFGDGDAAGAPLYAAPTINFTTMTADMTSMFVTWSSTEFYIGDIANVTSIGVNTWELSWSQFQTGGPFMGATSEMTMVVSTVPVPAAAWLFGSGLLAFVGVARRKILV